MDFGSSDMIWTRIPSRRRSRRKSRRRRRKRRIASGRLRVKIYLHAHAENCRLLAPQLRSLTA
jgi:hypothetical protein